MSVRTDFITTSVYEILQQGVAAAECLHYGGIESYPILDYLLQSVFLRMTGFEEQKLRKLMTDDDREGIDAAYKDAIEQTLWERITKTNHKDVTYYKALLKEYTCDLLLVMREDFLEEITGHDIKNKAFEDD